MKKQKPTRNVSLARHQGKCNVCTHPQRQEIEQEFVNWANPTRIAADYSLSRDSIYRHASAAGLMVKRQQNIRRALERIIEQAGEVDVNANAVVSAIQAYSKINAQGQWVDRSETVNLNELFDRMTRDELEAYAKDGRLPDWFPKSLQEAKQDGS